MQKYNSLLKERSPHLFRTLKRLFKEVPPEIIRSFEISNKESGNEEINFTRKPGTSYNPRAARIPLIYLEGGKEEKEQISHKSIELSILSSILRGDALDQTKLNGIKDAIASDHHAQLEHLRSYLFILQSEYNPKIDFPDALLAKILVCLFIDTIRHSHLSDKEQLKTVSKFYAERVPFYYNLSQKYLPFYTNHILRWKERNERI